jgi:hypothetical protein
MTTTAPPTPETQNGAYQSEEGPVEHPTDQERFDAVVDRDSRVVLSILAAAGIIAAIGMSAVALLNGGKTVEVRTVTQTVAAAGAAPTTAAAPAAPITLSVAGGIKRGPDGIMHDAFTKTNFAVKVGQPTLLRIDNKDNAPHTITAAGAGVAITVLPGVHTYKIVAQAKGRFEWVCILPCDDAGKGWAMTHPGYMAGYITAS